MKTSKKVLKKVLSKVKDKTVSKGKAKEVFPSMSFSRTFVLLDGLKRKRVPLNKEINLSTLKIDGKLFSDLVSSRPLIGTTTRGALRSEGYKVECIKAHPDNKKLYSVIKITK